MRDGFVKVAAVTPKIRVADTKYNAGVIVEGIREAAAAGAKVIVLPELVITGYTCSDLFLQEYLLEQAKRALGTIAEETAEVDAILFVGLPLAYNGKLYNVAAVLCRGEVLGFVPKTYLPNYNEFYEARHFARGMADPVEVDFEGECVPMGTRLLFVCTSLPELKIGAELCEDLWTPEPPSIRHARNGATLLVNLSASDETTGKDIYRRVKHKKKEPGEILVFSCFIGNYYEIRCKMKNIHLKHFLKRLYSYTKTDKMYIIRLHGIRKRRK